MNFKKLTAFAVVATMVVGNSVTAFAAPTTTDGAGIVEYDDSTAIEYDSVTVPTMLADSTYEFKLDPTGKFYEYGAEDFNQAATIYFKQIKDRAYIVAKENVDLYTASYGAVADTAGKWSGVVTAVGDDGAVTTLGSSEYYVWSPKASSTSYEGEYVNLDKDNIADYFIIEANKDISIRRDYKAAPNICDGKLYQRTFTQATDDKIVDSDADPLSNYITLTAQGALDTVKDGMVFTDNTGTTAATASDVDYVKATDKYEGESMGAITYNRSTKDKTLKVSVELLNPTGLDINGSETFAADNKKASVYFAVNDGTNNHVLAKDETTGKVKAEFSVDLAKATDTGSTTYQKATFNDAGGHEYARYRGPAPTYTDNTFKIKAAANAKVVDGKFDADLEKAWNEYGATIDAEAKRPKLTITYSVEDTPSEEEQADAAATEAANAWKTAHAEILAKTTETVEGEDLTAIDAALTAYAALSEAAQGKVTTEKALLDSMKTVAEADGWKTTHAEILAKTTENVEYADLTAIDAALTDYAALSEAAQGEVTTEKELLDSLKTAAEAKEVTTLTGSYDVNDNKKYKVNLESAVSDISDITDLKVEGTAVSGELNNAKTILKVARPDIRTAIGDAAFNSATEFTFTFSSGGKKYTCTIGKD